MGSVHAGCAAVHERRHVDPRLTLGRTDATSPDSFFLNLSTASAGKMGLALIGGLGLRSAQPVPDLFIKGGPEALTYLANTIDGSSVDPLTGDIELATALWVEQAAQARLMWERPYDRKLAVRAHHLRCPVRVIWGAADRLLAPTHGAELASLLGAPAPTVVAGAGHLVSVDAPEAVAEAGAVDAGKAEPLDLLRHLQGGVTPAGHGGQTDGGGC